MSSTTHAPARTVASPAALRHPVASASQLERVTAAIGEVTALVPPLWPLEDYVAVNPFLGLAPRRFLDARQLLRDVRDCEMLLPAAHFHDLFDRGEIASADVERAFRQCAEAYPDRYAGRSVQRLTQALSEQAVADAAGSLSATMAATERRYHTVSEVVDRRLDSSWSSHVITDISRHCGLHYDKGQASWASPWKHLPLYEAWREAFRISRRMDMLGLTGFRKFVAGLPAQPEQAVAALLTRLGVPEDHWRPFLLCEISSVAGWASFLRYRLWHATLADGSTIDEHLVGLLAIRLAYDAALAELHPDIVSPPGSLFPASGDVSGRTEPSEGVLARHLFQVAAEVAYRRRLCRSLVDVGQASADSKLSAALGAMGAPAVAGEQDAAGPALPLPSATKTLQMVFCIDVRSEVFRRHLESLSTEIETFGFAGFFGMALEMVPVAATHGPAQCPVLLSPGFRVTEQVGSNADATAAAAARRGQLRLGRKAWKTFQTSATSCFSFVESLGLAYLPKLLSDSLGWTRPVLSASADGVPARLRGSIGPDVHAAGAEGVPFEKRLELATGMLRNLGLVEDFARIVAICGHASEMVNNPYRAGYDCGACGGHSGEPNARVAAAILNDAAVRQGLAERGIVIPADTWFVPAVHVTTTDEIRFLDTTSLPESHTADFAAIEGWMQAAGAATRLERSRRLGAEVAPLPATDPAAVAKAAAASEANVVQRSRDWSEVRPEWGLAGNAAFIIAPRSRTAGLDLGGRTFMHSYDHARDPEGTVLELIMTAPMIVTSWINLQYYASAVDNRSFGSGNKLIHNVTGQLGVLLGNGGDLMTGLPWQAVSNGQELVHEPLRLAVVIEAPRTAVERVIEKHRMVADLLENGWLTLLVREGDDFFRWTADGEWLAEPPLAWAA
jgi:uncharacterized protein YbcC (UPF0753/DUF2309 family)